MASVLVDTASSSIFSSSKTHERCLSRAHVLTLRGFPSYVSGRAKLTVLSDLIHPNFPALLVVARFLLQLRVTGHFSERVGLNCDSLPF